MTDLRFALRLFARNPWFTLFAILPLALGIGVNASILGLVDALMLRPMPGITAKRLVWVSTVGVEGNRVMPSVAYADVEDLRRGTGVFEELMLFRQVSLNIGTGRDAERLHGELVSGNYFTTLGVTPARGRTFLPDQDRTPATHPVAVISWDLWQRRFNGDPAVVGRHLVLNATDFIIVGVAPRGFVGTQLSDWAPQVWVPSMMHRLVLPADADLLRSRDYRLFQAVGRLKPGVTLEQATGVVSLVARRIASEPGGDKTLGFMLSEVRGGTPPSDRDDVLPIAGAAFAISTIVLIIACANAGGLLLGRATARGREIGIRVALGAGRGRLLRQLLTESLLLALAAGAAGLVLATWTTGALVRAAGVPFALDVRPTPVTLGGTFAISLAAAVLFGLTPALHASRPGITAALESGGASVSRRRARLQRAFAVAQVALSLALLATAGILVRSVQATSAADRADRLPEHVLTASVDLSAQGYQPQRQREFGDELLRRLRALPGVEAVSLGGFVPGRGTMYTTVFVPGATTRGGRPEMVKTDSVWPGYFVTLDMRLLAGRDFAQADGFGGPRVAVVNETFVTRFWQGGQALGKQIRLGDATGAPVTIVGVVREPLRTTDAVAVPAVYLSRPQQAAFRLPLAILARTSGPATALGAELRRVVFQLDPSVPLFEVATLRQVYDERLLPKRAASSALDVFGGLALFLASVGVYGLAAWTVSRRQREIGVRMALGATRGRVLRMVLADAGRIALIGSLVGLALAAVSTRLIAGMMTGAMLGDVPMFAAVTTIVVGVVFLASCVPALRATRVDPAVVLRVE